VGMGVSGNGRKGKYRRVPQLPPSDRIGLLADVYALCRADKLVPAQLLQVKARMRTARPHALMNVHARKPVCTHASTHPRTSSCVGAHTHARTHAHTFRHALTHTHAYPHTFRPTLTHTHLHTLTLTLTLTHTNTHTHTHAHTHSVTIGVRRRATWAYVRVGVQLLKAFTNEDDPVVWSAMEEKARTHARRATRGLFEMGRVR
jgi:hypothetical protein